MQIRQLGEMKFPGAGLLDQEIERTNKFRGTPTTQSEPLPPNLDLPLIFTPFPLDSTYIHAETLPKFDLLSQKLPIRRKHSLLLG